MADVVSDWALAGMVPGLLVGAWRRREKPHSSENAWPVVWLLLFLATAVSAYGGGRFGYLAPQRLLVFLGLPLAILAAGAVQRWRESAPRLAHATVGVIVGSGVCTAAVTALCFLGPLGHPPGKGPFPEAHRELMTTEDAQLLHHLGHGMVLAPLPFGDVVAQRPGNRAVFGTAMIQAGGLYVGTEENVARFFSEDASPSFRKELLQTHGVDYVYCPDTWPVTQAVVEEFRALPFLEEAAVAGQGALFRVRLSRSRE